jgi:acetate kinase
MKIFVKGLRVMKVLVINAGSSSIKYQLFEMPAEKVVAKGVLERIGEEKSKLSHSFNGSEYKVEQKISDHAEGMKLIIATLTDSKVGVIKDVSEITAVGHRVVHGGEKFTDSIVINEEVIASIEKFADLAPLHNPPNLTGIRAAQKGLPDALQVACFDTAFHTSIPIAGYIYALPYEIYEKYHVRKYGFHGTSHKYVSNRAAEMLGIPIEKLKIISCHLGNGASVCAVKFGKSVDTSMGFTPLSGLAMGTRSGTIDPAVVQFLMEKEKMTVSEVNEYLNTKSGVLGISGISSDFRDVRAAADEGNERAHLAIKIFCYRVKKYIAEYAGVMNGVDVIVFTAGVGENDGYIRKMITTGLEFLGVDIDNEKNKVQGKEMDISAAGSKVKTLVVPTNEELAIARETIRVLGIRNGD